MLKHLTITLSLAALLPACTIVSDGSASDTNNSSNTATDTAATTAEGTTEAPTTANPTTSTTGMTTGQTSGMTTDMTTGQTTDIETTDVPTTDGTTNNTGMTTGTTGQTTGMTSGETETTGGGLYGNCGWVDEGYYACGANGGVEDPEMKDMIACPDGVEESAKCTEEMGPVKAVGCCTPEGVNYYCDIDESMMIFVEDCGV